MEKIKEISLIIIIFCSSSVSIGQTNNSNFKAGEFLKYEMSYGWITGGVASLSINDTTYAGKPAFHVKAVGKTVGIAHTIYNVRDTYESLFDPKTCKPYKSSMNLKEADYRKENEVWFNHTKKTLESKKSGKHKIKVNEIFDILSAFYALRKKLDNLHAGQTVTIHTYFHDEPWDLVVRYKGTQIIKTKFGKLKCLKFNPVVEEGTFESEDALDVWISADKNRIPIRAKMKFFVGSFKTDLVAYKNIMYPLGSK